MPKVAIAWPRSSGGQVTVDDVRLVIEGVPTNATVAEILAFGGTNRDFDHVLWEESWSAGVQLAAPGAPVVEWRAGPPDFKPDRGTPRIIVKTIVDNPDTVEIAWGVANGVDDEGDHKPLGDYITVHLDGSMTMRFHNGDGDPYMLKADHHGVRIFYGEDDPPADADPVLWDSEARLSNNPLPDPPEHLADAWRRYRAGGGEGVTDIELRELDEWRGEVAEQAGF